MSRVAVIGAGSWGTALANVAAAAGNDVTLWARDADQARAMQETRENARYLTGVALGETIMVTDELTQAAAADAVLLVVPAQATREVAGDLEPLIGAGAPVVLCAKGIERESGKLQGEIAAEVMPGVTLAVLSGPTFAEEVALGLPTAVTLACADTATGESLMHMLGTPTFRPYVSSDIVGAQIGGALKNVIAIACGIVDGRGLGHNARAALIARGVAEIARLGAALGASERTLLGLSGVGDLTLTCTSAQSRNYALGAALGAGEIKAGDALAAHTVTEGVHSGPGVLARAASFGLDMPISAAVTDILHAGADIRRTIDTLLSRPFRQEHGSA